MSADEQGGREKGGRGQDGQAKGARAKGGRSPSAEGAFLGDSPAVLALFEAELGLVDAIARQLGRSLGPRADLAELVNVGRMGLLDAARKFDSSVGASFRVFARYRVFGAIVDEVRRMALVPRRTHERLLAEQAVVLAADVNVPPQWQLDSTNEQVLEDALTEHIAALATAAALGAGRPGDADPFESWSADPEQAFERAELLACVRAAMEMLPVEDAEIIRMYYFDGLTLEQIAGNLEISRSWACRLHRRALERLTERLAALDK